MCVITNYFCPRCKSVVPSCDQPCGKKPCEMIFIHPVQRREYCSFCQNILREIEETRSMIESMKRHLKNAQMDALADQMAGLSTGGEDQLEGQLEELERKLRWLNSK